MKPVVFLGVVLLVACAQVNGQSPQSIVEDYKKSVESMLSSEQNSTNLHTLFIKINAFFEVTGKHGVDTRAYRSIIEILNRLRYVIRNEMITPERILNIIGERLTDFDLIFDQLNKERDVDEIVLPSKINDLVDEFVKRYTETSVELFDNMFTQTKHLGDSAEKPADESSAMVDAFAENIEKCLAVPKTEFKEILKCHQNTREAVLPNLAHNSALLNIIASDLQQLDSLKLDGKISDYQLYYNMRSELPSLYKKIDEVREQREAEKDKKSSENNKSAENSKSEESNE